MREQNTAGGGGGTRVEELAASSCDVVSALEHASRAASIVEGA